MPGSLLSPPQQRVSRNESTRSDHSDGSNTSQSSAAGKKVSFSKAVRVKKYGARPKKNSGLANGDLATSNGSAHGAGSPEKRFWFKVYKNRHRKSPDPKELRGNGVIYYDNNIGGEPVRYDEDGEIISYHPNPSPLNYPSLTTECGTQTLTRESRSSPALFEHTELHPSQMPTEPPHVRRNHVKKIVNRFNEDAVFARQRSLEGDMSPPGSPIGSPRHHSTPIRTQRIPTPPPEPPLSYSARFKKNPIVNGVKVMFGMGQMKKKERQDVRIGNGDHYRNTHEDDYHDATYPTARYSPDGRTRISEKYPYRSEIRISDGSDTEIKVPYDARDNNRVVFGQFTPSSRGGLFGRNETTTKNSLVPTKPGGLFARNEPTNGNFDDFSYEGDEQDPRRGKYHVETFDSGNKLVFDTTDVNTSTTQLEKGQMFSTVGEKHQMWQNNKRIVVYEEPSPRIIRRKAKSHSDLSNSPDEHVNTDKVDKGVSTEHLSSRSREGTATKKAKDSWLKLWKTSTRDKGVQCDKIPTIEECREQEFFSSGKYKILRPRVGVATAYSNVLPLEKGYAKNSRTELHQTDEYNPSVLSSSYHNGDIYSQVDKSKKKKNEKKKSFFANEKKSGSLFKSRSEPLYIGPPPKGYRDDDGHEHYFFEDDGERTIKTSKRRFGFHLRPESDNNKTSRSPKPLYREENWYDVDDDVKDVENRKGRVIRQRDRIESRQDLADDEFVSDISSGGENMRNGEGAGSVMREVDYKKREISYENVHRPDGDSYLNGNGEASGNGLWFRDADEDYRKEMAQNEVSYPAGSHVGSDRFYTINRMDKTNKQKPPPSPRAYTLDRRHFKEKRNTGNTSGVKILVNGKEVSDSSNYKKNKSRKFRNSGEDPSSVQSDPLYVRGGLAAAYQSRQRAGVRRSNSTAAGLGNNYRAISPVVRQRYRGTSEASGASSETEVAHSRKPLVMYIPGISHPERSPIEGDRTSGINVARSQSMMTSTRPSRIIPKSKAKSHQHKGGSKQDLYRNNDLYEEDEIMPLASDLHKKKPPKVPYDSKKNGDIKRRHSMPKDTKFSWLKWKIRGKPSREP